MKKIQLVFFGLLLILSSVFATETGQYKYFTYGQDFNLNEFVIDVNGARDTDFSADCNITIRQDSTGLLFADGNAMLNDSIITGLYYIPILASDTNVWTIGKYSSIMNCEDYGLYGTENVSFILDRDIIQTIVDTNAIGKGLNADQNAALYSLIDTDAPIIVFDYPISGSSTSSSLVSVSFYSKNFIRDVNVYVNGVLSTDFNDLVDCFFYDVNKGCDFNETGFVLDSWNDLNVEVWDSKGYYSLKDINFYYTSPSPVISFSNGWAGVAPGNGPVHLDDFDFVVDGLSESGFILHSFSKVLGVTGFNYNVLVYDVDKNLMVNSYSGFVNIGFGEQKNSIELGALPVNYYLDIILSSGGTSFELFKYGHNYGIFSFFVNSFFSGTALLSLNGGSIFAPEVLVTLEVEEVIL